VRRPVATRDLVIEPGLASGEALPDPERLTRAAGARPTRGAGEQVILIVAANPLGSDTLAIGEESAEIEREIKMTPNRDQLRVESRFAITVDRFMGYLTELAPGVVHFSGHGGRGSGLMFQDKHRRPQPVSGRALGMMIRAAAPSVRLVVLNACYTAEQAEALRKTVDCVVGMDGAIGDDAARSFAARFYSALGHGRPVANAVEHGIAALAAEQLPDDVLPRYVTRRGVAAGDIVFGPAVRRRAGAPRR